MSENYREYYALIDIGHFQGLACVPCFDRITFSSRIHLDLWGNSNLDSRKFLWIDRCSDSCSNLVSSCLVSSGLISEFLWTDRNWKFSDPAFFSQILAIFCIFWSNLGQILSNCRVNSRNFYAGSSGMLFLPLNSVLIYHRNNFFALGNSPALTDCKISVLKISMNW